MHKIVLAPIAALLLLIGCASQGPVVMEPPTARVSRLASTVISPDLVKFEAQVVIQNRSSSSLSLERVDYTVDLQDTPLFSDTFTELLRTKGRGQQTVTFHFQIAMKDLLDKSVPILAEGGMRVAFRGSVVPASASGFGPTAFRDEVKIPIPRIPEVTFSGADGTPLSDVFRVRLRVRNTNTFAVTINSVESYLDINQQRYRMLHNEEATELQPDGIGTVTLRMENTPGKTLSMALSALQAQNPRFSVGGTIQCRSPYGWIVIPLAVENRN